MSIAPANSSNPRPAASKKASNMASDLACLSRACDIAWTNAATSGKAGKCSSTGTGAERRANCSDNPFAAALAAYTPATSTVIADAPGLPGGTSCDGGGVGTGAGMGNVLPSPLCRGSHTLLRHFNRLEFPPNGSRFFPHPRVHWSAWISRWSTIPSQPAA